MKKPKTRQRGEGSLQEANSFNEDKKNIRDEQLEEDEEQESEVSKEVGKKRSRRRWTQRPGDELKLKQTFNKRRKGLVSKAYQLSYLTQAKDVYQRTRKDSNEDLVDNQDDISDLGRIRVQSNQPGIVYNLSTQIDIAKDDDRLRRTKMGNIG
eukprot:TRINITY_DN3872_c0_g1_i8.p2 TRINITY_DN3872_c0_g1~~TRINITY_DN3872_c0_g1_i8.p2  ORF type:complete len:153 (+),score=11.97 TRINITY_DN3872_c0_g1_i8:134-592(+)